MPAAYSKDIIKAWEDTVWQDTDILRFTHKIHPASITDDIETTVDLSRMVYCGEINFVQFFVQRYRVEEQVGTCLEHRYRVQVQYYLEDSCDNQNKIQEFFEVLDEVIVARLGQSWEGTVTHFLRDTTWPVIRFFGEIQERPIYVGSFTYFAEVI
jgi:hypothetical protein